MLLPCLNREARRATVGAVQARGHLHKGRPERPGTQVLPRVFQHFKDLTLLGVLCSLATREPDFSNNNSKWYLSF